MPEFVPVHIVMPEAGIPDATTGAPFSFQVTASGGTLPYRWWLDYSSSPELTINPQSGLMSGTFTEAGAITGQIGVVSQDPANVDNSEMDFTITVNPVPVPVSTGAEFGLYCTETPSTVMSLATKLGIQNKIARMSTYCGNPNNTSMPSTPSTPLGYSVGVGKVTQAEAQALGAAIYATGRRGTPYRVMWEYNSSGMSAANWYVPKNLSDSAYESAFQPITTGLRAGDPSAVIVFNGNLCGSLSSFTGPYPGDEFIDEVWIDYYDGSWRNSTTDAVLLQILEWAVSRGKPTGFGEWGTYSGSNNGNNGSYITWMFSLFANPAYGVKRQLLFSNQGDGSTDITHWPEAMAAYIAAAAKVAT